MAELATIARPYAEALFRVAETGDLAAGCWAAVSEAFGKARWILGHVDCRRRLPADSALPKA